MATHTSAYAERGEVGRGCGDLPLGCVGRRGLAQVAEPRLRAQDSSPESTVNLPIRLGLTTLAPKRHVQRIATESELK